MNRVKESKARQVLEFAKIFVEFFEVTDYLLMLNKLKVSSKEFNLLHLAAYFNDLSLITLILDNDNVADSANCNNVTPLHIACNFGNWEAVVLLLSRGANINACTKNGETPLLLACENNHSAIISSLLSLSSLDVNKCDNKKQFPLDFLLKHNNVELIAKIIEKGGWECGNIHRGLSYASNETLNIIAPLIKNKYPEYRIPFLIHAIKRENLEICNNALDEDSLIPFKEIARLWQALKEKNSKLVWSVLKDYDWTVLEKEPSLTEVARDFSLVLEYFLQEAFSLYLQDLSKGELNYCTSSIYLAELVLIMIALIPKKFWTNHMYDVLFSNAWFLNFISMNSDKYQLILDTVYSYSLNNDLNCVSTLCQKLGAKRYISGKDLFFIEHGVRLDEGYLQNNQNI